MSPMEWDSYWTVMTNFHAVHEYVHFIYCSLGCCYATSCHIGCNLPLYYLSGKSFVSFQMPQSAIVQISCSSLASYLPVTQNSVPGQNMNFAASELVAVRNRRRNRAPGIAGLGTRLLPDRGRPPTIVPPDLQRQRSVHN
jgi:hypothetical protein